MVKLKSVGRYVMEERTLGKGNFAVVELASHTITKSKVAVKIIDRRKIKEEYMQQNMYREARVMSRLRHPNVVRLYETIKTNHLYFLVTEYVAGGDLLTYVRNQRDGYLSEPKSRGFVRQLVSALHHLHERGVVHRDLKMENIILDEKRKNLKLIDFGLSNVYHANQLLKTHCGSPEYAAPELFVTGREYGPEVDIWSLGVIVYAMVTGKLPFSAPHTENRRQRLLQQINAGLGSIHESDMQHLSEDCRDLLRKCIEPSLARIHLLDIMTHPWVTVGGKETFYTFQQPPKDPTMRTTILEKMASLLGVDKATLDAKVNENHCDDSAAIFNLLLDHMLRDRGMWEGDHTRRTAGGRRQGALSAPHRKTADRETTRPSRSQAPLAAIEAPMRLRTPTIVGMVRPSSRSESQSPIQSADFELSVVDSARNTPDRPRSSAASPNTLYTRPMGNATTVNSILARQQHFPRPATSPGKIEGPIRGRPNLREKPKRVIPTTKETRLVAPHPSSADLPASRDSASADNTRERTGERETRNGDAAKNPRAVVGHGTSSGKSAPRGTQETSTSKEVAIVGSGNSRRNHVSKQSRTIGGGRSSRAIPQQTHKAPQRQTHETQPDDKASFNARQRLPSGEPVNNLSEKPAKPEPRLQVIDMGRYFSAKHGYQVSETPIAVHPGPSRSHNRGAARQPSPAQDRKASLCNEHLDQLQRNNSTEIYDPRDSSRSPAAVGNHSERTKPRAPTPVQIQLHQKDGPTTHTHAGDRGREKRQNSPPPIRKGRAVDTRKNSIELPVERPRADSPDTWSNVSSRPQTPVISYLKRTGRPPSRSLYKTPVAGMISSEGCIPNAVRRESHLSGDTAQVSGNSEAGMPPRPEWRRSQSSERNVSSSADRTKSPRSSRGVRQPVPDRTLRVQSAKMKKHDEHQSRGQQSKNNRRVSKQRKEPVKSTHNEQDKMMKYAGHTGTVQDKETSDGDLGVLGEFSTRGLLGALLSRQTNEHTRTPQLKQNKLITQKRTEVQVPPEQTETRLSSSVTPRQRYVHVPAFNFINQNQLSSTKTKCIDVQRPPVVRTAGAKAVQVFDIQKSHDVTSVDLPPRSVTPRSQGNTGVDWGKTYALQRKVSDTIKGGNDIARMRRTPEPVRYS